MQAARYIKLYYHDVNLMYIFLIDILFLLLTYVI